MKLEEFDIEKLKKLPLRVFMVSDLVAYCVNIPLSIIIVFLTLKVGGSKIVLFSIIIFAIVCAAGVLTYFQLKTFFAPVMEFFRKLSAGEAVSEEEYFTAKIRFYSAPAKRAVSGMVAWIVLMPVAIILFTFIFTPSLSAKTIIYSILAVNIISVGALYYLGIDRVVRDTAKCGIFSRKAAGEDSLGATRSSTVLAVNITGFVVILCALMIPIANSLFYSSVAGFFSAQMKQNTTLAESEFSAFTGRYAKTARSAASNNAVVKVDINGLKNLAAQLENDGGEEFDSILLLRDNGGLKILFSYGGGVSFDLQTIPLLLRVLQNTDSSGEPSISAIISPMTGKPVLSFAVKTVSGTFILCTKTDSFASKELYHLKTGVTGEIMILDRFNNTAANTGNTQPALNYNNAEFNPLLSVNNSSILNITSGDDSFLCAAGNRDNFGIRALSTVKDREIESYGMKPVIFISIFICCGLALIGYIIYRILTVRLQPLEDCRVIISAISSGDLSVKAVSYSRDDIGQILTMLLEFKEKLRSIMGNIHHVAGDLAGASSDMSKTSLSVSINAQGQAASVEEITATAEEITAGMQSISYGTESQFASLEKLLKQISELANLINRSSGDVDKANAISRDISDKASEGSRSLSAMNESISRISARSGEMTNIVGIINDISDRINLLSLNAAIEAARAGDSGRGFAVVADEISKLADQTAVSIKEIDRLIRDTNGEIESGLSKIEYTTKSIGSIIEGVGAINTMMDTVAASMNDQRQVKETVESEAGNVKSRSEEMRVAAEEQKNAMDEVMKSITSINQLTQENADGSDEMAQHAQNVEELAGSLKSDIEFFKI